MIFGTPKHAISFYIERKECGHNTPTFFLNLNKYMVSTSYKWVCTKCRNISDTHTGYCELCNGDLVVYKNCRNSGKKIEQDDSGKLDAVNFIIDFERILERNFNSSEVKLLLMLGYLGHHDAIKYMLENSGSENDCKSVNKYSNILSALENRLREILIKTEYMENNEPTHIERSRRTFTVVARNRAKTSYF